MKQKLSALYDGALDEDAAAPMLDALRRDGVLRQEWDTYCLIGDALRDEELGLSPDFTANVMGAIQDEPVVLAPVRRAGGEGAMRHLMPIAASVMGVAAVGWVAATLSGPMPGEPRLAREAATPAPVVALETVRGPAGQMMPASAAEPSEREYLFAHQLVSSPATPMPGVATYVRSVSETRETGAR